MSLWTQLLGLGASPASDHHLHQPNNTTGLLGSLQRRRAMCTHWRRRATCCTWARSRVWRDRRNRGGFWSRSSLVKAIVVGPDGRIFTGHQDRKVCVWLRHRNSDAADEVVRHRQVGSLPRACDAMASALLWGKRWRTVHHVDAVSCLSLDAAAGLLYSGSLDRIAPSLLLFPSDLALSTGAAAVSPPRRPRHRGRLGRQNMPTPAQHRQLISTLGCLLLSWKVQGKTLHF